MQETAQDGKTKGAEPQLSLHSLKANQSKKRKKKKKTLKHIPKKKKIKKEGRGTGVTSLSGWLILLFGETDFLHTIDSCGPLMHFYSQLVS